MITEDYVSFETAKLLKEKGFDEGCVYVYRHDGSEDIWDADKEDIACQKPTLQMAMKWLREVHHLHCNIGYDNVNWYWNVQTVRKPVTEETGLKVLPVIATIGFTYNTYEEACEAAIKFCLKNLIKNEDEEESDIPVPKTVDEAISTLEKILSDEDREYLLENGAISMHHSLGRWIRNEWGLWTGSELKDELMSMNKGLNHPDDMSNYIIEEFIKYWNSKI